MMVRAFISMDVCFLLEVIDAAGQGSAADGACGELVLSSLTAEAEPVLRCRTGLHVRLLREQDRRGYEQVRMVEE